MPLTTITANPLQIHGNNWLLTLEMLSLRITSPKRRKSMSAVGKSMTLSASTWTVSIRGNIHSDSRMEIDQDVASSHWKKLSNDMYFRCHATSSRTAFHSPGCSHTQTHP